MVAVAVTPQLLGKREEFGIALPAIEQCDPVPTFERGFGNMSAEKKGAAEYQQVHRSGIEVAR